MAQPYYAIRDSNTGLYFSYLSATRSSERDILHDGSFLCMGKYAKVQARTIDKLEKLLRKILGEMNPPPQLFSDKSLLQTNNNRIYRKWTYAVQPIEISNFPSSFEVVYIVPSSGGYKRSVMTANFSLVDFAKQTGVRRNRMRCHGPAYFALFEKLKARGENKFTHALIFSSVRSDWRYRADTKNINQAMTNFGRHGDVVRASLDGETAIAFKNENSAFAFRLGYPGTFRVKMIEIR